MPTKNSRWDELPPGKRRTIVALAVFDMTLRAWAMVDLVRRPQNEVKGPKAGWAFLLAGVNSAGVLPTAYLAWARRGH